MLPYSRKYERPAETKRSTGQPIGTRDSGQGPFAAAVGRVVTLRRPHEDRRTDARLRLVAIERVEQRTITERASDDRTACMTQLACETQRERQVDEARL